MRILVDPTAAKDRACFAHAAEAVLRRQRGVLLTTVRSSEHVEVASRWFAADQIPADLPFPGADSVRSCLARETPQLFVEQSENPRAVTEVLVEPMIPKPLLLIAGGGHVGQALAIQADLVGFDVTVIDDRAEFTDPALFPPQTRTCCGDIPGEIAALAWRGRPGLASHVSRPSLRLRSGQAWPRCAEGVSLGDASRCRPSDRGRDARDTQGQDVLATPGQTYIVIVTRGHKLDAEALEACVHAPVAYIGMIGSKRKVALLRENFLESGLVTQQEFDRVFAPIGLDIGAVTVPEIAASIVAELIAVRRNRAAYCVLRTASRNAERRTQNGGWQPQAQLGDGLG